MATEFARYECVCDPFGNWFIWDKLEGVPAVNEMVTFIGMQKMEAETFCRLLNGSARLHGHQNELLKVHFA